MTTPNTPATQAERSKQILQRVKAAINSESVFKQLQDVLGKNAGTFANSVLEVIGTDNRLKECEPAALIFEAMKAATLHLPLNRSLGFAWLVPRKVKGKMVPVFQIGYKGFIQLAQRTGQYKHINAGPVYEGELVKRDKLSGTIDLSGEKKADAKVIGYFAHIETINGFKKTSYMTYDEVVAHAKEYSDSYGKEFSAWATAFDQMATKTVLKNLLDKYGVMSIEMIEMQKAMEADDLDLKDHQTVWPEDVPEAELSEVGETGTPGQQGPGQSSPESEKQGEGGGVVATPQPETPQKRKLEI